MSPITGNYAAANADSLSMFVMDLMIAVNYSTRVSGADVDSLVDAGARKTAVPASAAAAAAATASVPPTQ